MTSDEVRIHLIFPASISTSAGRERLTADENARADRFHFEKDASHWIACRSSLREILGQALGMPPLDVPLIYSEHGKPLLAAPCDRLHFNLSHSADLALVALTTGGPVGIDLEATDRAPDLLECVATFCHPDEIKALPQPAAERAHCLLRIWTAKEAVLKALGTGLSFPPENVTLHFDHSECKATAEPSLDGMRNQRVLEVCHPALTGHVAFVSVPENVRKISFVRQLST